MEAVSLIPFVLAGTVLGCVLACIPGLHVATSLALLVFLLGDSPLCQEAVPLCIGLVVSYAIVGFVPMVMLSVPDEGLFGAVAPAQVLHRDGLGPAAVLLGAAGGVMGVLFSSVFFLLLGRRLVSSAIRVLAPHWHWIVWTVSVFILMSEWPQRSGPGLTAPMRFLTAWRRLIPGVVVFAASAALGLAVFFRGVSSSEGSFASLMPMVTGIFSVPWLLIAIVSNPVIPRQKFGDGIGVASRDVTAGMVSGCLGGTFACIVPGVTAGVGGLLAGHTFSLNSKGGFLIAQGCARSVYLCGSMALLFVPGVSSTRGACAMMIRSVYEPFAQLELPLAVSAMLFSTTAAALLTLLVAKSFLRFITRVGARCAALLSLSLILLINLLITGLEGLLVMGVASAIGGAAILYGVRRMNCLACILVPVGVGLSGWGGLFQ